MCGGLTFIFVSIKAATVPTVNLRISQSFKSLEDEYLTSSSCSKRIKVNLKRCYVVYLSYAANYLLKSFITRRFLAQDQKYSRTAHTVMKLKCPLHTVCILQTLKGEDNILTFKKFGIWTAWGQSQNLSGLKTHQKEKKMGSKSCRALIFKLYTVYFIKNMVLTASQQQDMISIILNLHQETEFSILNHTAFKTLACTICN